ncbi:MAG: hypothetical protein K8R08_09005 [Methanosarcinales archaeon]|nr:hypothetical protein [Methanosarcinales archaeon]
MDIDDVLVCLSQIDKTNLHKTIHFEKRVNQRKDNIQLKLNSIDETIINEKPVCISKQDDTKFRLCYDLDKNYDLIIVLNIKTPKPLTINLVTCYNEDSKKRRR